MYDHEIIYISAVVAKSKCIFHPFIERVEIHIGEQLTGEIADR